MAETHTSAPSPWRGSPLVARSTSPSETTMPSMTTTESQTHPAKTTRSHRPFSAMAAAAGRRVARAQRESATRGSHCHTTYPARPR
ncbi:hypothetical protein BJF82_15530 [Kytococcus sp. CUA-901]|nr:hypothetical protein BJF82_15530 [Kytococcus sp. CUA-901]